MQLSATENIRYLLIRAKLKKLKKVFACANFGNSVVFRPQNVLEILKILNIEEIRKKKQLSETIFNAKLHTSLTIEFLSAFTR